MLKQLIKIFLSCKNVIANIFNYFISLKLKIDFIDFPLQSPLKQLKQLTNVIFYTGMACYYTQKPTILGIPSSLNEVPQRILCI